MGTKKENVLFLSTKNEAKKVIMLPYVNLPCSFIIQEVVSPEEAVTSHSEHPDAEFEGMGDYEESFLAEWWQEPKSKWDAGEDADWHPFLSHLPFLQTKDFPTDRHLHFFLQC